MMVLKNFLHYSLDLDLQETILSALVAAAEAVVVVLDQDLASVVVEEAETVPTLVDRDLVLVEDNLLLKAVELVQLQLSSAVAMLEMLAP
tara:strand:- start:67 stop:336 length:270 start_codon:yes stop_codon:yes gene_type:complete